MGKFRSYSGLKKYSEFLEIPIGGGVHSTVSIDSNSDIGIDSNCSIVTFQTYMPY